MTELPERIWACMGGPMVGMFVSGGNNGGWPEYVRADAIEALTAERDKYSIAWMTAEGKLADAESDIAHLHKLLAEAASDLTAYVDAEYPPDTCAQYPDIARRHHRDMELVRRIEAELKGESHD